MLSAAIGTFSYKMHAQTSKPKKSAPPKLLSHTSHHLCMFCYLCMVGFFWGGGGGGQTFFCDLDVSVCYLLRKCAYRDIQHII